MKKASQWLRKSVVSSAIFAGNRALGFLVTCPVVIKRSS